MALFYISIAGVSQVLVTKLTL